MFPSIKSLQKLLSCKHYSELTCKSRDKQLTRTESLIHYFHHALCFTCRRFSKQIDFIDSVCRRMKDADSNTKLSDDAKSRICSTLKEEANKNS